MPAFLSAVLAAGSFMPLMGSAQVAASDATFCSSLDAFAKNTTEQIALQIAAIEKENAAQNTKLAEAQSFKDSELQKARLEEDATMASVFAGLESKASTTPQKAAVIEFKKAVNDASDIRQASVDGALAAYRDGLQSALADQKKKISDTLDQFSTTVSAELEKAKASCASGTSASVSRPALKQGLKLAKDNLAKDQKKIQSAAPAIDSLVAKRRSTITHSDQDFKGALRAARNDLSKVFPDGTLGRADADDTLAGLQLASTTANISASR